jgi:GTP-binding protein
MSSLTTTDFRRAQFLTSAAKLAQCPPDTGTEVAFAGRSNAGKSSCINVLTDNRHLARASKTPGRTRLINFFALNEAANQRLVDLPGYGYAKVSQEMKEEWQQHLENYLRERETLRGLVLLMDIRHPLKDFDINMLDWREYRAARTLCVDQGGQTQSWPCAASSTASAQAVERGARVPVSVQLFSAPSKQGVDELAATLGHWLAL